MLNSALQRIPNNYSINLMWINRTLDPSKPYICTYTTENDLITQFLDKVKKWKVANPEAEVNIWYDSKFVTQKALLNTQSVLNKLVQQDSSFNIKLRDIRDIDIVKNNPDVFSDNVPIYFLIDLLKLIICLHSLEADFKESAIFTDLEVGDFRKDNGRMSKNELFNPCVMKNLEDIGILFNLNSFGFENQFVQVLNKPETLVAMKVIINANLTRAVTAFNLTATSSTDYLRDLPDAVFASLPKELIPLIVGLKENSIRVNPILFDKHCTQAEWISYDPIKHGCLPLGNLYLRNYRGSYVIQDATDPKFKPRSEYIRLPHEDSIDVNRYTRGVDVRSGNSHNEFIEVRDNSAKLKCQHFDISNKVQRTSMPEYQHRSFSPQYEAALGRYNPTQVDQYQSVVLAKKISAKKFHCITL